MGLYEDTPDSRGKNAFSHLHRTSNSATLEKKAEKIINKLLDGKVITRQDDPPNALTNSCFAGKSWTEKHSSNLTSRSKRLKTSISKFLFSHAYSTAKIMKELKPEPRVLCNSGLVSAFQINFDKETACAFKVRSQNAGTLKPA